MKTNATTFLKNIVAIHNATTFHHPLVPLLNFSSAQNVGTLRLRDLGTPPAKPLLLMSVNKSVSTSFNRVTACSTAPVP